MVWGGCVGSRLRKCEGVVGIGSGFDVFGRVRRLILYTLSVFINKVYLSELILEQGSCIKVVGLR
jgi:hypothetical protein